MAVPLGLAAAVVPLPRVFVLPSSPSSPLHGAATTPSSTSYSSGSGGGTKKWWPGIAAPALASGTLAAFASGRRAPGGGRQHRRSLVPRRFFNFGEPQPEVDPKDPGRVAVCGEYQNMPGSFVCAEESEFGFAVVTRHDASEQDDYWPSASPPGAVAQEWRELRLADRLEGNAKGTGQSVVKVSLSADARPVQVPYCMALAYTRSMCAVSMTGLHLQGNLPLDNVPKQRALVVGLGAGSIPLWLNHTYPEGKMIVDAVEIDPAVVRTAVEALGFPENAVRPADIAAAAAKDAVEGAEGQAVRTYLVGGEVFVEELAKLAGEDYKYDMVFIDAFDKAGKVPPALVDPEGPFLLGLQRLLADRATVVMNLLVGLTGSGSSGGFKDIQRMVSAVYNSCCDSTTGEVFTVRTPIDESSGNQLFGFLTTGRQAVNREAPLKAALKTSAEAVNAGFPADSLGQPLRFDFARRVNFSYKDWAPPEPEAEEAKAGAKADGGFLGGFFGS